MRFVHLTDASAYSHTWCMCNYKSIAINRIERSPPAFSYCVKVYIPTIAWNAKKNTVAQSFHLSGEKSRASDIHTEITITHAFQRTRTHMCSTKSKTLGASRWSETNEINAIACAAASENAAAPPLSRITYLKKKKKKLMSRELTASYYSARACFLPSFSGRFLPASRSGSLRNSRRLSLAGFCIYTPRWYTHIRLRGIYIVRKLSASTKWSIRAVTL